MQAIEFREAMLFYITSRDKERYGHFSSSIRRVGKLAFWLALSAICDLLTIILTVLHFIVGQQPRTFDQMVATIRFRMIGYVFRVFFSFAQVYQSFFNHPEIKDKSVSCAVHPGLHFSVSNV